MAGGGATGAGAGVALGCTGAGDVPKKLEPNHTTSATTSATATAHSNRSRFGELSGGIASTDNFCAGAFCAGAAFCTGGGGGWDALASAGAFCACGGGGGCGEGFD